MKNFFIKCHREYVARRGGSGGSDFDTTFDNGWRKLIKEPARAHVFCALVLLVNEKPCIVFRTANKKKGDRMKTNFFDIALALRLGAA